MSMATEIGGKLKLAKMLNVNHVGFTLGDSNGLRSDSGTKPEDKMS